MILLLLSYKKDLFSFTKYFILLALTIKLYGVGVKQFRKKLDTYSEKLDLSLKTLKASVIVSVKSFYFPALKGVFPFVFLTLFLEVFKEMPINMILKDSSHQTLATKIFELTSEGEWERASVYALIMIVVSLFISYFVLKEKN